MLAFNAPVVAVEMHLLKTATKPALKKILSVCYASQSPRKQQRFAFSHPGIILSCCAFYYILFQVCEGCCVWIKTYKSSDMTGMRIYFYSQVLHFGAIY